MTWISAQWREHVPFAGLDLLASIIDTSIEALFQSGSVLDPYMTPPEQEGDDWILAEFPAECDITFYCAGWMQPICVDVEILGYTIGLRQDMRGWQDTFEEVYVFSPESTSEA